MSTAILHAKYYELPAKFPVYYSNSTIFLSFVHTLKEFSIDGIGYIMSFIPPKGISFRPLFEVLKYNRTNIHLLLATPSKVFIIIFTGENPLIMFTDKWSYGYIGRNRYSSGSLPDFPRLGVHIKPYDLLFHGNLMVLRFNTTDDLIERLYRNGTKTVIYDNELQISNHKITANNELAIFTVRNLGIIIRNPAFIIQHPRDTLFRFDHPEHGRLYLSTKKPAFILLYHPRTYGD